MVCFILNSRGCLVTMHVKKLKLLSTVNANVFRHFIKGSWYPTSTLEVYNYGCALLPWFIWHAWLGRIKGGKGKLKAYNDGFYYFLELFGICLARAKGSKGKQNSYNGGFSFFPWIVWHMLSKGEGRQREVEEPEGSWPVTEESRHWRRASLSLFCNTTLPYFVIIPEWVWLFLLLPKTINNK